MPSDLHRFVMLHSTCEIFGCSQRSKRPVALVMVTCDHNMAGNESDASSNASTIVSRSVTFNELLNDNDMAEVD